MKRILILACSIALLWSCKENIDESARYVFQHDTMASYLKKHEDDSEYVEILKQTPISLASNSTVFQLMSARGNYTVFAPTNEAIHAYLEKLTEQNLITAPSWESFQDSTLRDSIYRVIAYNSIIDGGDVDVYHTYDFPTQTNGEFDRGNLMDLKLTVLYTNNPDEIFICKDCPVNVRNRDILTTNGVLHQMEKVIAPDDKAMSTILSEYISGRKEGFHVIAKLCEACGLMDTLSKVRDEVYEERYLRGQITPTWPANGMASVAPGKSFTPKHRKYGFTIFAEPDEFWEAELGKKARDITPEDVQKILHLRM